MKWCITEFAGGWTVYNFKHKYVPYKTWFLKRDMFKCACGKKITPGEYHAQKI